VKDQTNFEQDVIRKAVEIVRPLAERKGLYLHEQLANLLPWVLADAVRLRQVLVNLLTNAVRFTDSGGITIKSAQVDGNLLVQIVDTGLGIPADEIPKLFQEFHQAHLSENRESAGSGLGLSICKHLVELHGGEIWVESGPSLGTTFSFTIPLPGSVPVAGTVKTPERLPAKMIHHTCLVVHDDVRLVRLLARYIEGYRMVGVSDLVEAISLVDQLHPRAILTSPDRGEQLQQQLGQRSFDVPIITCGLPSVSRQAGSRGILGYLVKPITAEMVAAVMHRIERKEETTVLLVDDDPDTLRLLELLLISIPRPYNILKAQNGRQALDWMQSVVPDIVFMDLLMPEMDGWEAIAGMRDSDRLKGVPVVVVTARDWSEEGITLDMPLCLHARHRVDITKGARYLQALLDWLTPSYLAEPGVPQRF
jgi:CheY-like chemotaxis protein/anti-sigma regulatory factor (Ser/Thr protein kinase)